MQKRKRLSINSQISTTKASIELLKKEKRKLRKAVNNLTSKIAISQHKLQKLKQLKLDLLKYELHELY